MSHRWNKRTTSSVTLPWVLSHSISSSVILGHCTVLGSRCFYGPAFSLQSDYFCHARPAQLWYRPPVSHSPPTPVAQDTTLGHYPSQPAPQSFLTLPFSMSPCYHFYDHPERHGTRSRVQSSSPVPLPRSRPQPICSNQDRGQQYTVGNCLHPRQDVHASRRSVLPPSVSHKKSQENMWTPGPLCWVNNEGQR